MKTSRFFRGQSNYNWGLVPGLYRDNMFVNERILIKEALHRFPHEFENLNKFSVLVKMQHYGLKTRLLDLTANPMIALYFSCLGSKNDDGALFLFNNVATHYSDDALVETQMDFIFKFSGLQIEESTLVNHYKKMEWSSYSRRKINKIDDLIDDLTLPGFCVVPIMNNNRLIAQQGAFILHRMIVDNIEISSNPGTMGRKYYSFAPYIIENELQMKIGGEIIKFKIPKEVKPLILAELETLNISEASIYTDIERQLTYVNNHIADYSIY